MDKNIPNFSLHFIFLFFCFFVALNFSPASAQIITTVAGIGPTGPGGSFSGDGGPATIAGINRPDGIAFDRWGNMYFADVANHRIRKVDTAGIITTICGNGTDVFSGDSGAATLAGLESLQSVAADTLGNLYIGGGWRVRKIDTSGVITTIAGNGTPGYSGDGGPATAAVIVNGYIAVDRIGNVYIASDGGVRKINTTGIITTIAGNGTSGYSGDGGPATAASMSAFNVAVDNKGSIFIVDISNYRIRKVNSLGIITTIAGNGIHGYSGDGAQATLAQISETKGVSVDGQGNVYITDYGNQRIRRIDTTGIISTVTGDGIAAYTGDGGPATAAEICAPWGIANDNIGNLYFSDNYNNRVRKVTYYTPSLKVANDLPVSIDIFPNPNKGSFSFRLSSAVNGAAHIIITNAAGTTVKELTASTNQVIRLKINGQPGIYTLNAATNKGIITAKVVVIK